MYVYKAQVLRVAQGDLLELKIDLGFRIHTTQLVRLLGVKMIPFVPSLNLTRENEDAKVAMAWVTRWLNKYARYRRCVIEPKVQEFDVWEVAVETREAPVGWQAIVMPCGETQYSESLNQAMCVAGYGEDRTPNHG